MLRPPASATWHECSGTRALPDKPTLAPKFAQNIISRLSLLHCGSVGGNDRNVAGRKPAPVPRSARVPALLTEIPAIQIMNQMAAESTLAQQT